MFGVERLHTKLNKKEQKHNYDLRKAISSNRLVGLWRLLKGYQLQYIAAVVMQGLSAYSKTLTYLLLSYFVDNYLLGQAGRFSIEFIAFGFVALAGMQGLFTFMSGRLVACLLYTSPRPRDRTRSRMPSSA